MARGSSKSTRKKATKRKPFQEQSYRFYREHWTMARAKAWLQRQGHAPGRYFREEPDAFVIAFYPESDYQRGTLHPIYVAKNVEAVVGVPLAGSEAVGERGYGTRGPRQGSLFSRRASGPALGAGFDPDDVLY